MSDPVVAVESVPLCNLCGSGECSRSFTTKGWQVRICAKCGLGRTDPRPISPSLGDCYGEDYWRMGFEGEQYTPREVKHLLYRYGRRARYLKRYKRNGRLLEIGTGFGFFLESARRQGYEVQGVEYSPWVAEKARAMFNLPVQTGSVDEFDPGDVKYDVIVMWHVLEHLADPWSCVRRVRGWLKSDGIFAVEVPNCGSVDASNLGAEWDGWSPPHHLWHFTSDTLDQMLEKAGLHVVGTKYGRSTYIRHRLKRYPVVGWFRCLVDCWYKGNWVRKVATAGAGTRRKKIRRKSTLGQRFRNIRVVRWTRKVFLKEPFNTEKLRLFWHIIPYTMCNHPRLNNVYDLAKKIEREKIEGAFVECGVWKGGCAAIFAYFAQQGGTGRKTWLFDSFEGLPEPTEQDGEMAAEYAYGKASGKLASIQQLAVPLDDVKRLFFSILKLDEKDVVIEKGWFQDTLPAAKHRIGPIAILRLDGDWYDSIKCCLDNLYDNVIPGGYVIVDDYNFWEGCKRAVDEFFAARDQTVNMARIDNTGVYFQKD